MSTNQGNEIVDITVHVAPDMAMRVLQLVYGDHAGELKQAPTADAPAAAAAATTRRPRKKGEDAAPAVATTPMPPRVVSAASTLPARTNGAAVAARAEVEDDPMPVKGSTVAPVDTTSGEDGTEDDETDDLEDVGEIAAASGDVPPALKSAEKAREVFGALIAEGYNTPDKLKAICRKWQKEIPFLEKFGDNLDDRVDRACDVLFK